MIDAEYHETEALVLADGACMVCHAPTSRHTCCARCGRTLCWRCARPAGGVYPYDPSRPLAVVCAHGRGCSPTHEFIDPLEEGDTQPHLTHLRRATRASAGQGLVEYALIIALVAVVVIVVLIILGPQIASLFQGISNNL